MNLNSNDPITENQTLALDRDGLEYVKSIGKADIVIGIPSYNNADSIGRVIKAADLGLAKYFPLHKSVIMVSEGGDVEETRRAVNALKDRDYFSSSFVSLPKHKAGIFVTKYQGLSGKGTAMKAIFEACDMLNSRAGCMLDSDLRSISPEWIELLVAPILVKEFEFVTPYYSRHKYDGTITNMIAYPLTCSLYGRRVRQPIGGDFGYSLRLVRSLLDKDVWETDIARFGIDIWMTTVAICEGMKICQSYLGTKIHDEKDPGKDLSPMFRQVVGTILGLMEMNEEKWLKVKGSRPTAIFGFESESAPKPINVDVKNLIGQFREGMARHLTVWEKIIEKENFKKIEEVARMNNAHFELPIELWIKALYDFAVAYKRGINGVGGDDIVEALVPLYFATTASFVRKTQNLDSHQAEEVINHNCGIFENLKPYLIEKWVSAKVDG